MNRTYRGEREGIHGNVSPFRTPLLHPALKKKHAVCPSHDGHAIILIPWLRVSVACSSTVLTEGEQIYRLAAHLPLDGQDSRQEHSYTKNSIICLNRPRRGQSQTVSRHLRRFERDGSCSSSLITHTYKKATHTQTHRSDQHSIPGATHTYTAR